MNINGKTKLFGIIGNPVSHSLSPVMHNRAFESLEINAVYVPFKVENISDALAGLKGLDVAGASVTIPHKESIIPYLDKVDPVAERIGAVNTVYSVKTEEGVELHGLNTDWIGANRALQDKTDLEGKKVVVLGAGGSARAICFGLLEAGASIVLCSRTASRGKTLAGELGCPWVSLEDETTLSGDILVNATSVGMAPREGHTLVRREHLGRYSVVMDIVYAPLTTRLLQEAREEGCETVNGLEMLLYQGVAQFELWTGRNGPVDIMRDALLKGTGNR